MALQTHLNVVNTLMKQVYVPGITDQLHNQTPGLSVLRRSGREAWRGGQVELANRTGRNRSYRATNALSNEQAAFPTAGRQSYDRFTVGCRLLHGTGGVTAFGAAASSDSDAAFAQMLKAEIDGHLADVMLDKEIDFFGTELGVLGKFNGAIAGAVITLDQAQSLVAWEQHGNRYFSPGQLLDIITVATGARVATDVEVSSVATANRTQITLTAAPGVGADGDLLVRAGTINANGGGAAPGFSFTGLESLIANTTTATLPAAAAAGNYELDIIQGVDRNSNSYAEASVIDLNNANLSRSDLNNLVYQQHQKSGYEPDVFLMHGSVQLAVADLMVGDQRYQPQKFPGGFKADALVWAAGNKDIPILACRNAPYDRIYGLNLNCIEQFELVPLEMIETDGSILRQSTGDSWTYTWREMCNIGSRQPNGLSQIVRIGGADETYGGGAGRLYDF